MANTVEGKLHLAVESGGVSEVASLLSNHSGLDVNCLDRFGCAALHLASNDGHVEVVKLLLAHPNINVNLKNKYGETPILLGCWDGCVSVVRVMLRILVSISHLMTTRAALHCGGHLVMASMK